MRQAATPPPTRRVRALFRSLALPLPPELVTTRWLRPVLALFALVYAAGTVGFGWAVGAGLPDPAIPTGDKVAFVLGLLLCWAADTWLLAALVLAGRRRR